MSDDDAFRRVSDGLGSVIGRLRLLIMLDNAKDPDEEAAIIARLEELEILDELDPERQARRQAREMKRQATIEAQELTRDPDGCRWRVGTPTGELPEFGDVGRFCKHKARHDDGLCTMHHESRVRMAALRERMKARHRQDQP